MTVDEGLNQLAAMQCPRKVDVVDGVMAYANAHPYMMPVRRTNVWRRVVSSSVAAVLLAAVASVVVLRIQVNNDAGIGSAIAQVQDYGYYSSSIEEAALNPIEYIYE